MRSHQQKFLANVEAIANEYGMELVVDPNYVNTGWITISFEDAYEPIVRLFYDFQVGNGDEWAYANFKGLPNDDRADRADEKTRSGWYLQSVEFPKILKVIRTECARAINARREAEIADMLADV